MASDILGNVGLVIGLVSVRHQAINWTISDFNIDYWILRNKLIEIWMTIQILFKDYVFEIVICLIAAILIRPQCVNS